MGNMEGESEVVILAKATPHLRKNNWGAISYIGVTTKGDWKRLYLSSLQALEDLKKINRWHRIKFSWKASAHDSRPESCDIDQHSIKIIGELPRSQRQGFLTKLEVKTLASIEQRGQTLLLLRPRNPLFFIQRKTDSELQEEQQFYNLAVQQLSKPDLNILKDHNPCPYQFKYKYTFNNEDYEGVYDDWRIYAAFAHLSESFGEARALMRMIQLLGKEYPEKGMAFILEAESSSAKTWLINSIINADELFHMSGNSVDVVT